MNRDRLPRRDEAASVRVRESGDSQPSEPGWWLATDGRWYPPDARPGVPAHRPRHRAWILAACAGGGFALVLLAIVIVIAVLVIGSRPDYRQLPRLRRASEQLAVPSTWTLVQRDEEPGAGWLCPMSCPKAEVDLMFKVPGGTEGARPADPAAARSSVCATLRASVDRDIAPTRPDPYTGCRWWAPLPQVGSRASVWAGADAPCDARGSTCVEVTFSGGPRG
jgi:hypothetical protein